ncbi:hypothetical protein ABEB36_010338 [Hypothenemus hampei]|uniref:Zinc transporter ZIP13 n=1 Tax=Hypothenemus hampei TaxID=57062 RepID=A0ABD1EJC7_HYPHA
MVISSVLCVSDTNATGYQLEQQNMLQLSMPEIPEWFHLEVNSMPDMPWAYALFGSFLVGLSGVLPLLIIDVTKSKVEFNKFNTILSFGVGALLGDVFLHSLPEIYSASDSKLGQQNSGLYVLGGLIAFIALEKLFNMFEIDENETLGWLNLLANVTDNFMHGMSVGGSFLVSNSVGIINTFTILIHEIPHEVGDFAILLRAGFNKWTAAFCQLGTAMSVFVGASCAIHFGGANSLEAKTSWIVPFTTGTFLHIGLVTILPKLLKEEEPGEALRQMAALLSGILMTVIVQVYFN